MYTIEESKDRISQLLDSFKIGHSDITFTTGPTVTLFEFYPQIGTKASKIRNLKDELALALRTTGVRVIVPTERGTVGIEVPCTERKNVKMMEMLYSDEYMTTDMALPLCIGRKVDNSIFMADLATMPHLLVAGATGMGKSVGLNAIITSLLSKRTPDELKLVLIDPKQVEFTPYRDIAKPYLLKRLADSDPIITDVKEALNTLSAICDLMDSRYTLLKAAGVRNLAEYNATIPEVLASGKLPYIVVIVDEFADLMLLSRTNKALLEEYICRIAQKARAVGIHMIVSTQRPSTEFVTGCIKANFSARIAFRTTSGVDSRVILGAQGAEKLAGKGDFIFSNGGDFVRAQCAYISTEQVVEMCHDIRDEYEDCTQTLLPEAPVSIRSKSALEGMEFHVGNFLFRY